VASGPVPPHRVPEAVRPYLLATTLREVLGVLLDDVRGRTSFERLVVVATFEGHARGAGVGIPDDEVARFATAFARTHVARASAPRDLSGPGGPVAELSSLASPTTVTLEGRDALDAAVVVDSPPGHPDLEAIRDALGLAVPFLAKSAEAEDLRRRVRNVESRQRRARTALDALSDPVLVMDSESRSRLANRRAEELFVSGRDDSPGRRHALETNNLLFSAFRARAVLEGRTGQLGEVILVDPIHGSDLLFEVVVRPFGEREGATEGSIFVLRDITDLKQATHELEIQFGRSVAAQHAARRESERLNVIIENAGAPILVTDPRASIMLMNREAERLLAASAAGAPAAGRVRDVQENAAKLAGFLNEFMLHSELRREGRLALVDPEIGNELPSLVVSTKILDSHREATAVVTVLHDLTQEVENQRLAHELRTLNTGLEERVRAATQELAERNARLERQSSELERASRMKSEFLATMSHELRTPINAVLGYNSLLRDGLFGDLTEEQQDALLRMRNAAEHLLTLISDILDLSRVEAGQIQVSPSDVDLAECLGTLAESVRPMAEQKSLRYTVDLEAPIPPIRTDVTRLRQVLLNLLSNAVKFTQEGSVTLRAGPGSTCERVRIEVIDTGIGIEPVHLESIFDEFTQADQSATRRHGGAGLGLTISRRLIEVMGGEMGVRSELGRGSTFHVELPVLPPVTWGDTGSEASERGSSAQVAGPATPIDSPVG
jgi:PAS domain S-box-containing protein